MLKILKRNFKGGVHPPENKKYTESKSIEEIPLPEEVIIPLQQHLGKPSKVIVNTGDKLNAGDLYDENMSVSELSKLSYTIMEKRFRESSKKQDYLLKILGDTEEIMKNLHKVNKEDGKNLLKQLNRGQNDKK